jgi:hypothetical protein
MYPDEPAGSLPCTRCGHTLWQHSTGECDINGCACEGWTASCGLQVVDVTRGADMLAALLFGWAVGLLMGWLVWGAWL